MYVFIFCRHICFYDITSPYFLEVIKIAERFVFLSFQSIFRNKLVSSIAIFSASLVLVSFVNIYLDLYFAQGLSQLEKLYHISVVFLHYYVYYYYLLKETHTFDPDKRIKIEIESNTGTENKRNNNANHLIILLNKYISDVSFRIY